MESIRLKDVLKEEFVVLDCPPFASKQALFREVSQMYEKAGITADRWAFLQALEKREDLGSTYMGDFVAIPHGKSDYVKQAAAAFFRCSEPFSYVSGDEVAKVKYIFVLAIPEEDAGNRYISILAELARSLMDEKFKQALREASCYEEIIKSREDTE